MTTSLRLTRFCSMSVCLHDLLEPVHVTDRDGGRAGGDGVEEVLQDRRREVVIPLYAVSRHNPHCNVLIVGSHTCSFAGGRLY